LEPITRSYLSKNFKLKGRTFLYHSLFWAGIYLLWVAVFRSYSFSLTKTITIEFCYLIFITADYYAINNFIIPQFLLKTKYVLFVLMTLLIITLSAWLRTMVAMKVNLNVFHVMPPVDFRTVYFNSVVNISIWVLLITLGKMLVDRIQTQQFLERLERERVKNELDYLKAQINPHALFNSLNTIYGHIDKTNQVARNTLLQFSELLRHQLYDCSAEKVSLEKEIQYIENYVAFQRLRKSENLAVTFQTEVKQTGLMVAPLLLLVLIENAFKFVSNSQEPENKIIIKIRTEGHVLHGSFINTKDHQLNGIAKNSKGIGIANLTRRLDLLYGNKFKFTTQNGNNLFEAHLTIDLS
jgi:two-component system LytT family sensor kinase